MLNVFMIYQTLPCNNSNTRKPMLFLHICDNEDSVTEGILFNLKPRSHIACNRSATSLRPKFRVVAGWLQGGCKEVGDWSPTGCRRLQGRFGRKEVLVAASETSLRPDQS